MKTIFSLSELIEKYGQKCADELLNMVIIVQQPTTQQVLDWLYKYKIAKKTTKKIYFRMYRSVLGNDIRVCIKNGRGTYLICI